MDELKRSIATRGLEVPSQERIEQACDGDFACWSRAPHRKRHGQFSPTRKSLFRGQRILGDFVRESGRSAGPTGPRRRRARTGLRSVGSCGPRPLCSDTSAAFDLQAPIAEQPANVVRSADWCFVSVVEDKPWYNDRSMWPPYFTLLTTARFNRSTLSFGLGYDYPQPVKDAYFYFAYPFLISVPGYTVRAVGLPDAEREHNLEMLQYISGEAASRGLDFQLGLWTHAYRWPKGSDANYTIEGLTPQTHAPYCRDALYAVLQACPGINGVALHVHGESGIPEMDFAFWQTLLEGVVRTGRRIEINLHAKGMSERMIDIALAQGCRSPFRASTGPNTAACRISLHRSARGKCRHSILKRKDFLISAREQEGFPLQLWRSAQARPPLRDHFPHLVRNPAVPAVGRPGDGRRRRTGRELLRQPGHRPV